MRNGSDVPLYPGTPDKGKTRGGPREILRFAQDDENRAKR